MPECYSSTGPLPPDVWEHVAFYLGPDAANLSLLNSALRAPGQRGLFGRLTFTGLLPWSARVTKKQRPAWIAQIADLHELAEHPLLRTYITRVELVNWTSGHTDPLVYECGEALFNMLAVLPNLACVQCTNVSFKSTWFQVAFAHRALPLDTLILHNCIIPFDTTESYRFRAVDVTAPQRMVGFGAQNYQYAIASLLEPTSLRELRLDMPDLLRGILGLLNSKDKFMLLKKAELVVPPRVTASSWPELALFLARCPVNGNTHACVWL